MPHFNARESIIRSRADAYYLVENTIIFARIQDILSVFRLHHTSTSTFLQLVLCVQCRLRYLTTLDVMNPQEHGDVLLARTLYGHRLLISPEA